MLLPALNCVRAGVYDRNFITYDEIMGGGSLGFNMTSRPQ